MFNHKKSIHGTSKTYFTQKTTIEIPSRYVEIIEKTIQFLELTGKPPIVNQSNCNYSRLKYLLQKHTFKEPLSHLEPLAVYKTRYSDGYIYELYLTREDLKLILDCSFVVDVETLIAVLNRLDVRTKNDYKINFTSVYKWKILTTEEWKERYKRLMNQEWQCKGIYQRREIKNSLIQSIDSGQYDQMLRHITQRIEVNHLSEFEKDK